VITRADLAALDNAAKDELILAQAETIALLRGQVEALTRQVEVLSRRVAELEARLGAPPKTPDNSSLPPSRGQKASGQAPMKPKGAPHKGSHRALHPHPTRTLDVRAERCAHCTADVSAVSQSALQRYDRIELPEIEPDVTRVVLYGGLCPCCARRFKAAAPEGFEPGSPFGPNLRAFLIYLRAAHAVSFERLARLCRDLFGLTLSEGALVNILKHSKAPFAKAVAAIRARLLSGSILQSDETSMRVGKKTWWNWVFHHGDGACFVIAPSRGKDVVEAFLGARRPDFWVSDRLAAQMGWATKEHQVCLAHLIRDAQYAIDAGDAAFAPKLKGLLERACRIGRRRQGLKDATLRSYARQLDERLGRLLKIVPATREGEKLRRMIKRCRQHLFVFLENRDIPPTNNGSEQALRPCVTFRKVTNCFRSEWGANLYADIRSVLETARRRAIDPLHAIRLILTGEALPAPA
jgi:transposase